MPKKLKCFVASAFGYRDVDTIYDKIIVKVLKELDVEPLRVDRVEHNEDIDDKIFKLIDIADFSIADLTYARPSVYYEAGYTFGSGKQVIYIARKDHLKPVLDDTIGNFRVHFDLQMKNIIPWDKSDTIFKNKIKKRINYIIKGLGRVKTKKRIQNEDIEKFSKHSRLEQIKMIDGKARNLLRVRGFIARKSEHSIFYPGQFKMYKYSHKRFVEINFVIIKRLNESLHRSISLWIPILSKEHDDLSKDIIIVLVIASFNNIAFAQRKSFLPSYIPLDQNTFYLEEKEGHKPNQKTKTYVYFIDKLVSLQEFEFRLKSFINSNELSHNHTKTR